MNLKYFKIDLNKFLTTFLYQHKKINGAIICYEKEFFGRRL